MKTATFLFIAAIAAAGNPPSPKPNVPIPDRFRHQPAAAESVARTEWWKAFGDPLLDSLMDRASHANLSVRAAAARFAEAQALRGQARSALLPDLSGTTSTTRVRGGYSQGVVRAGSGSLIAPFETSVLSGGFNMRWELDVFGGARKESRAAASDADAANAAIADAQSIVRSEVARNYIEMRGAQEQSSIVRANVEAERQMLELIRVRADAGLASDLDVERQASQLASVQALLPDLDTERLRAAHRIAVLLGEEPAALLADLEKDAQPLVEPPIPAAAPSELLKRRPDVRRAEFEIAAAYARAGAARADLYPKFVITGLSGRQGTDLSGLTLGAGNFFSVGPGVSLPIFNGGRIRSNIAARDARLEQALRAYESDVLAAFEETENAFVARDRAELKRKDLLAGFQAASRSVELAQELYLRGLADFLTVLDAQRQRFQTERELAASRTAVLSSGVALCKALGE